MRRICVSCKQEKPIEAFSPLGTNPAIRQTRCKDCITQIWRKVVGSRLEHIEDIRAKDPEAYNRMVVSTLYANAQKRAKKQGIEFTIHRSHIPLVHRCPILDVELRINPGKQASDSYSLDRIDSRLGYVPGNVRVISWRANFIKGNLTLEQAHNLVDYMEGKL